MSEQTAALLKCIKDNERVCPDPDKWDELWQMLPERKKIGSGWDPPRPLILGAWFKTSDKEKRERLAMHIQHAAKHGEIDMIDSFLRALSMDQWVYEGEV